MQQQLTNIPSASAKKIMRQCGADVTLITGPAVDINMSVHYSEKNSALQYSDIQQKG
jgi:hypothetical protein